MDLDRTLIDQAAAQHDVNPEVLVELLELAGEFPDMTAWGAKSQLLRRISEILEAAGGTPEA